MYALVLRLIFNLEFLDGGFSLFSVTFIWITPVVIGLIPLFYASQDQLKRWGYKAFSPVWTVIVFFSICFITRIEDLICLWVILIPYILGALTVGLIAGEIIRKIKNRNQTLYSIMLIPFILSPIEQQFLTSIDSYSVSTKVAIKAKPEYIWQNIIRVRKIEQTEYRKGFFNYAGIPRPIKAELDKDTIGATRVGYFEGGLKFVEQVSNWEKNKEIGFNINVVHATIRQTVFDQHVLQGDRFKFLNATYTLLELSDGVTELTLFSSYELKTNINSYAGFYGNQLVSDFQERLLEVIKKRCEKH